MASLPPPQRHLLVADNEPELTSLLAMVLEDAGYHVTSASSVEQACSLLAATTFALVLADSFTLQRDQVLSKTGPIPSTNAPRLVLGLYGQQRERSHFV